MLSISKSRMSYRHVLLTVGAVHRGGVCRTAPQSGIKTLSGEHTTPLLWRIFGGGRQLCASAEPPHRWNVVHEEDQSVIAPSSLWKVRIDHYLGPEDRARFAVERSRFRADPRLQVVRPCDGGGTGGGGGAGAVAADGDRRERLTALEVLRGLASVLRLADLLTDPFKELLIDRLTCQNALMNHFGMPEFEDISAEKPLHSKAVPVEGAYGRLRIHAYWLALHVWLMHSKQHLVQEDEGLFGSALCAFLTRRIFEWQWNQIRGWMHDADVPSMSLTQEVQDLQEYVFGLCVALDQAFKDEVGGIGTVDAVALKESQLEDGKSGLAPLVKHVLWANVYSGSVPHDANCLYELTVYLIRQRIMLEGLGRATFFGGGFYWADFAW